MRIIIRHKPSARLMNIVLLSLSVTAFSAPVDFKIDQLCPIVG